VRHLTSVVQGDYRDRVIVVHPQLRLYTRALGVFEDFKAKVEATAPPFNDENFVQVLALHHSNTVLITLLYHHAS
jgi:hypothetical protein